MTEQYMYQKLRHHLPHVDWMRVENSTGSGMFDLNACFSGNEFWVELKVDSGKVLVRPSQHAWALRRSLHGGRLFLLALKKDVLFLYKPPFCVTPYQRWLKVMDKPFFMCEASPDGWKSLLGIFCGVQA